MKTFLGFWLPDILSWCGLGVFVCYGLKARTLLRSIRVTNERAMADYERAGQNLLESMKLIASAKEYESKARNAR